MLLMQQDHASVFVGPAYWLLVAAVLATAGACAASAGARPTATPPPVAPAAPARRVEWVAHRGESYLAPENTMAAINLGWKLGADAVEFDVHLTRDGKLAVVHDKDFKRTAGQKVVVAESTLAELQTLDVGRWKGEQFAGERVPTIEQVLATVPEGKRLFIEVKVGPEAVPALVEAVRRSGKKPEQLVVISFNADTIALAKQKLPELKMYYLAGQKQDEKTGKWTPPLDEVLRTAKRIKADGVDVQAKPTFDAAFVRKARDAGFEVHAWTVDDPDLARQLVALGVDGITSNRPTWLRGQVQGNGEGNPGRRPGLDSGPRD
jgi:glycerophosphoryl diester phosphodiesterase